MPKLEHLKLHAAAATGDPGPGSRTTWSTTATACVVHLSRLTSARHLGMDAVLLQTVGGLVDEDGPLCPDDEAHRALVAIINLRPLPTWLPGRPRA